MTERGLISITAVRRADAIGTQTRLDEAFARLLVLAGATPVPAIGPPVTAAWGRNAALAVNNLRGGFAG